MAFTRRIKIVLITAPFYIGAGCAVFTSAPERIDIICLLTILLCSPKEG